MAAGVRASNRQIVFTGSNAVRVVGGGAKDARGGCSVGGKLIATFLSGYVSFTAPALDLLQIFNTTRTGSLAP